MSSINSSNKFSPKMGTTDSNLYLKNIFNKELECNSVPELINIMKEEELAPVKNRRTGVVKVSPGRHVRRITFGYATVDKFLPQINSDLATILSSDDHDYYVESSHCDLLFYEGTERGHHDFHTDEVPYNFRYPKYTYNSLIICLDSKISSRDDGATVVDVDGKNITYHTNRKNNYLLFSSEKRHRVLPVRSRKTTDKHAWHRVERNNRGRIVHLPIQGDSDEYVLKLKFDVWIRDKYVRPDYDSDELAAQLAAQYEIDSDDNEYCNGYDRH
tara:strand:- start:100 stop:915 length:816 start_codon:yes stop_codon:yes gene_type:complete